MRRKVTKLAAGIAFAVVIASLPRSWGQSTPVAPATRVQPNLTFEYRLDSSGNVRQIVVDRDKQAVQVLDSCTEQDIPRGNGVGDLAREDFNFDGYPDLAMRSAFDPRTENSSYCIWLYDPATQRFVLSQELSRLINPHPDPATQTVVARKNETCSERCYVQDTYKWTNGLLEPVREESLTEDPAVPPWSDCRWVRAVKKEKNGNLVEISRERVDSGGVMCEPHAAW